MRLFAITTFLGSCLLVARMEAQTGDSGGTTKAATASASTAKAKPVGTSRTDALTEGAPERKLSPAEFRRLTQGSSEDSKEEPAEAVQSQPKPAAPAVPSVPTVAAVPQLAVGHPTPEQVAKIKAGSSEKDMLAALGSPASCLTVPDDGHLRKTCKYWSKGGSLVGTIRLDNGAVVSVDATQ
jgi:hypothetical protein